MEPYGVASELVVAAVDKEAESTGIIAARHGLRGATLRPRGVDVHDVVVGERVVRIAAEVRALTDLDAGGVVARRGIPHRSVVAVHAEPRISARLGPQAIDRNEAAVKPDARSRQPSRDRGRIPASVSVKGDPRAGSCRSGPPRGRRNRRPRGESSLSPRAAARRR